MKLNESMFFASVLAGSALLSACGSGLAGEYGGDECLYDKIAFTGGDTAYITFFGTEQPATYRADGDRVIVTASSGEALVFTRNGRNLESGVLGETMVCSPL